MAERPLRSSNECGIVVLGLGNPIRGDDAVGLRVAAEIARLLEETPIAGVTVRQATRAGFELIDLLTGFRRAILVDCIETADLSPGQLRRLDLHDCSGSARLIGSHDIGLCTAFDLASEMGIAMPAEVEIIGVAAGDTLAFTDELSPAVAAAVAPLAREIHARLGG